MRTRIALVLAVVVSIIFHAIVLIGPDWGLSQQKERPFPRLQARLLQTPAAPAPVSKPKDVRSPTPKPVKPAVAPEVPVAQLLPAQEQIVAEQAPLAQSEPSTDDAQSAAPPNEPADAASAPLAASQDAQSAVVVPALKLALAGWVNDGCIKYVMNVQYGVLSGPFGQAEQCWQHNDQYYTVTLKGSAVVAWKQFRIEQESIGRIYGGVLVADVFHEKNDKGIYETIFDNATNKVRQTRNGETREVPTGGTALDMLALMHFMSALPDDVPAFDMFVVAWRGTVSRVTVVQQPAEPVTLPTGIVTARQFHAETRDGELKIDVWIAENLRNTPVRFRIDNKGDIFDFQAIDVVADGQTLAHRPEAAHMPPPQSLRR